MFFYQTHLIYLYNGILKINENVSIEYMSNPCNTQKVSTSSIFNALNPRYSLPYVAPTPDMFAKHKQLILKYSTVTNGPGYTPDPVINSRVSYKLNIDSVQYKNIIYMIPCRFRPHIQRIQLSLNQNQSIRSIFNALTIEYNIPDPTLQSSDIYQFQRLYTYPQINFKTDINLENNINNAITIPFKTGEIYDTTIQNINLNWSIYLDLPPNVFVMAQYCQFVKIINNLKVNNTPTYTSNFNDMYENGSASYIGLSLISNLTMKNFEIVENNITKKITMKYINVLITPQEQNLTKTFGVIINSDDIPILKYYTVASQLIFVPFQTASSIIYYQPYSVDMPFTIDTTTTLPIYKPTCTFTEPYTN